MRLALGLGLLVLLAAPAPAQPQTHLPTALDPQKNEGLEGFELLVGETSVRLSTGQSKRVTVVVREWDLGHRRKVARFPVTGLVVFHLVGGQLTTEIGGRRLERPEGGRWSVGPGVGLAVETGNDTALARTVELRGLE